MLDGKVTTLTGGHTPAPHQVTLVPHQDHHFVHQQVVGGQVGQGVGDITY